MEPSRKVRLLAVARLGSVRGLHGEMRLYSYSGEYEHIRRATEIMAGVPGDETTLRPLKIKALSESPHGVGILFEGYDTPEKARSLTGFDVYLPREMAAPRAPGEYYIADLVGMAVHTAEGPVGTVTAVVEGGADDLLEIEHLGRRYLVPFRKEFIGEVDEELRRLELLTPWILA